MTVLTASPKITSVLIEGLDKVPLKFVSEIPGVVDNSQFNVLATLNDKYIVKSIDGLGPPEADVAIANTASGGKYQGRTYQTREIVALISLNPNWDKGETPKFLRDQLYTMLSTGYDPRVKIMLMSGFMPVASTFGYVKRFENALFSKDPAVQITFECLDYTFKAPTAITYSPAALNQAHPNVYNGGTAETGFQFQIKFLDDMNRWSIKTAEKQNVGMEFVQDFNANDVLAVSTIPGSRYVHWNKRRGKVKNKMGILTNSSEWIQLHPGSNRFVLPKGYGTKWQWKGNFQFTAQYWGV